ncbi:ZIP family metal transporter [Ramlibacter rhizophilus]|uniref:ZIP family zinc transporter n=1 Tax=Ramlibacter rhizophilus TaxID=1781167 RepID=A0A4Z0BDR9_9BURK|nr:hypothetical protein [Ramlibacter rhizophilus]TFY97465.1 hypothetical protein EZ242_18260 [Ramlibacter rhizophilus]
MEALFDSGMTRLVGLALLPAVGMVIGSILAEFWRLPPAALGAVLHGAAGVAVAVVSIEMMPRILDDIALWQLVAGFALGAAASILMVKALHRTLRTLKLGSTGAWGVYLPVAVDLFGDGLMVGIGSAVSSGVGLMLALSQVVANIPGGVVTIANLRDKKVRRAVRIAASASLILPTLVGALAGYWLLRDQGTAWQNTALAFVAGMLLLATIEDLVPEADEPAARRVWTTSGFAIGFIFFAIIALKFGG